MQELLTHGLRVGRLFGIEIRVHLILLIWMAFEVSQVAGRPEGVPLSWALWTYLGFMVVMFGIILLHEFGHCFAARAVGGQADHILLWPFGGLAHAQVAHDPTKDLVVTAGGPAVNLAILLVLLPFMFIGDDVRFGSYFFDRDITFADHFLSAVFGLNLDLLVLNLIPMIPFDGGRLLQGFLWQRVGYARATILASYVGTVAGAMMAVAGIVMFTMIDHGLLLILLGAFGFFYSRQQRRQAAEESWGSEPSWGGSQSWESGASGDRTPWWGRWKERRQQAKAERRARTRGEQEREVDRILQKVSREGLPSLSRKERRILENASKRYGKRDP